MPAVSKKIKAKQLKKASPIKSEKKFISESLQKQKPGAGILKKKTPKHRRRGVVYIKHLPHGFYEEQLRGYFSQFGAITRLRLARSPKTLGSKGYAFIEFRYPEVAEIAADAMNNYIMFKNIIKTRFIPPNEIEHDYFRSGVKKVKKDGVKVLTSKSIEAREKIIKNASTLMTAQDEQKRTNVIASKVQKQKQKLAALGIDYYLDEVLENMGDKFMDLVESKKPKTIENLDLASDDEADDTFDPSQLDVDSDDDFEDFEYDSDHTDDDDGIDVNIDNAKLEKAVRVAREAQKKAVVAVVETKPSKEAAKKSLKRKTEELPIAPTKKPTRQVAEKAQILSAKPLKEKKAAVSKVAEKAVEKSAAKGKKTTVKKATVKAAEKSDVKEKKTTAKKVKPTEVPVVVAAVKSTRISKKVLKPTQVEDSVSQAKPTKRVAKKTATTEKPSAKEKKPAVKKVKQAESPVATTLSRPKRSTKK